MEVLMITEELAFAELIKRKLKRQSREMRFNQFNAGKNALAYLRQDSIKKKYNSGFPDLIILDVNPLSFNGLEILKSIKNDPIFFHLPVVVFCDQNSEYKLQIEYKSRANSMYIKPYELEEFERIINEIAGCWLNERLLV